MTRPVRSFLFVPGDSPRKVAKALGAGADALILDLEDSVAPEAKAAARDGVAAALRAGAPAGGPALWVRINPFGTAEALPDLAAVAGAGPAGIVLPKCEGGADVDRLAHMLDALEARDGVAPGAIRILAIATETAAATFGLGSYRGAGGGRLLGLTWGAEDLSAALGATTNRDPAGGRALTYRMVRSLALLGARAAGVEAIETVEPGYSDPEALRRAAAEARREGFSGALAIHPAQVGPINEGFSPDAADIAAAEAVVAAFRAAPGAGTVGLGGRMLDRPHLLQAERVLALRDAFAGR